MLTIATYIGLGMVALAMALNVLRLVRGPQKLDRILALDTMAINTIALVVLLGIVLGVTVYFEAALLIAMMGFVGTAALCKFLLSGAVVD
jgi:multicomponent K+:H+ antiporter subunit F